MNKRIVVLVLGVIVGLWEFYPGSAPLWGLTILKPGRGRIDTLRGTEDSAATIWPVATRYAFPDTAESLFVVFANINDTLGLEALEVSGLDSLWDAKTSILERPFGATAISVVVRLNDQKWNRVNSVRVLGDTTNTRDTLYVSASRSTPLNRPAAANIRSLVPPRTGRDQQMVYTVPDGKEAKILRAHVSPSFSTAGSAVPSDSAVVDVFVRVREFEQDFQTWDVARVSGLRHEWNTAEFVYPDFPELGSRTDVMIAAAVTASASFIETRGILVIEEE